MIKDTVPSNPLVQRLHGKCGLHTRGYAPGECVLCDAADEIERLERENEELRFVGAGDFEDNQRLRAENSAKDRHMADYHTMHDEIERLRAALKRVCAVDKATPGRRDCDIWAEMLGEAADALRPEDERAADETTAERGETA